MTEEDKRWAIIGGLVAFFVVILVSWLFYEASTAPPKIALDKNSCPKAQDKYIHDFALIVLDGTDEITGQTKNEVLKRTESIARSLPKHGGFSLHDITKGKERLMLQCALEDSCNPLKENCRRKTRSYEKNYVDKITKVLDTIQPEESDFSPIIQGVFEISNLSDFRKAKNRSIHIFSDMLHRDDGGYTHYNGVQENEYQSFEKPSYLKFPPGGVNVYVYYLQRQKHKDIQTEYHRKFWEDLFYESGAVTVVWENINLPEGEEFNPVAIKDNRQPIKSSSNSTSKHKPQLNEAVLPQTAPESNSPADVVTLTEFAQDDHETKQQSEDAVQSPASAPKSNLPKESVIRRTLSIEEATQDSRKEFVASNGKDIEALHELVDIYFNANTYYVDGNSYKEYYIDLDKNIQLKDRKIKKWIYEASIKNKDISADLRGKIGVLLFLGVSDTPKKWRDSYVLMKCGGVSYRGIIIDIERHLSPDLLESYMNSFSEFEGLRECN